jgi:hypothetical protein
MAWSFPRLGILPKRVGLYSFVDEIVEYTLEKSPFQLTKFPETR